MNVLIVANDQDSSRRDRLEKIVRETVSGAQVKQLLRAADPVSGDLVSGASERFQLILHHCGASNREYMSFLSSYRTLCNQRGWDSPAIILFSGGGVDDVVTAYQSDPYVRAVRQQVLEDNLVAFLTDWKSSSTPPWETLETGSPYEPALQALSALLPFGLLWETKGTLVEAANEIAKQGQGAGLPKFEYALQQWVAKRIQAQQHSTESDVQRDALMKDHASWVEKLGGDAFFKKIEEGLLNCKTVSEWNEKLTNLRNEWLKQVAPK